MTLEPPTIDADRLYMSAEVGEILQVHSSTVRRMAINGGIAFRKTPGGLRQYLGSDVLLAWLKMHQYLD